MIRKLDPLSPVFTKTGAATLSIKAGTSVFLAGRLMTFNADTPVTMPVLSAGSDYAIYLAPDGVLLASANFTAPSGYNAATVAKLGGFHYALGANAAGQAGGDTTPAINPYSIWDEKFRPKCSDPRGMVFISPSVGWVDIYLLNTDHEVNGTSKFNATIADGANIPKRHTSYGGNGTDTYEACDFWACSEIGAAHGKTLLNIEEFSAAAYGVTEGTSLGSDPGATGLDAPRTSKFGLMQAAGVMWIWSRLLPIEGGTPSWAWNDNTRSRGQMYTPNTGSPKCVLMGGSWGYGVSAGSRASVWNYVAWDSGGSFGARFRSDHLQHV